MVAVIVVVGGGFWRGREQVGLCDGRLGSDRLEKAAGIADGNGVGSWDRIGAEGK